MAANKKITGSVQLSATLTTNILNPSTAALTTQASTVVTAVANTYVLLNHIRVVNKTGTSATVSLWRGVTATNSDNAIFLWNAQSVGGNSFVEAYGEFRFDAADFLVGGAGTATALTIEYEGEIGIA